MESEDVKEIVGYKWLARYPDGVLVSPVAAYYGYCDPEHYTWVDGHLEAHDDIENEDRNKLVLAKDGRRIGDTFYSPGIHAYKSAEDVPKDMSTCPAHSHDTVLVLYKVLLSGKVIEGEKGYQAQYADIVGEVEWERSHTAHETIREGLLWKDRALAANQMFMSFNQANNGIRHAPSLADDYWSRLSQSNPPPSLDSLSRAALINGTLKLSNNPKSTLGDALQHLDKLSKELKEDEGNLRI